MIRDITIGQYYPVESKIHSLDPRFKLIATFVYITSLFLVKNLWAYIPVFIGLGLVIYISKVPIKFMLKGIRSIFIIILFTVIVNMLMTPEGNIWFEFYFIKITSVGVYRAVMMSLRLMLLIVGSSVLTLTTSPISLTDGIEFLLKPFKKIGVPSHEIAMMMTIALRFIPTLLEETDKIMKAQMARGADFDTGGIVKKAKSLIPLLVPLFISAFRRAYDLATAMEARCYRGGHNRTRMKQIKLQKQDLYGTVWVVLYVAVIISWWFL